MWYVMGLNKMVVSGIDDMEILGRLKIVLLIGIINLFVGVIVVVGNFFLCVIIYKDFYWCLRNIGSYLVVNLVVVDFFIGLLIEFLYVVFEIINFMGIELRILYVIGEIIVYVFVNVFILFIFFLVLDRFIVVKYFLLYV